LDGCVTARWDGGRRSGHRSVAEILEEVGRRKKARKKDREEEEENFVIIE
jgi:hypothetical protein